MTQVPISPLEPTRHTQVIHDPDVLLLLARNLRARAEATRSQDITQPLRPLRPQEQLWRRRAVSAVAILALSIAAAGIIYLPNTEVTQSPQRTYQTTNGQRLNVTLGNGTHVTLAPATTLQVMGREVTLDGEALFNVAKQPGSPFVVRTGDVVTTVLGTSFSVRSYGTDSLTRIAVAEGKVSVKNFDGSVILANGDFVSAAASTPISVEHDAEYVANLLRFTQGSLVLDVQSLGSAVPQLARWFDLDITADSTVMNRKLWVTLQNESVTESLDMIASITGTRYVRSGRSVRFTQR